MACRSLHLDVFSQIGWYVEIFAFDDRWLAFFKSSSGDGLELQSFLFRLQRFFGWHFFFLLRDRFLLWRNCERLVFAWNGWGGRCRFSRHRLFKRNTFLKRRGFHRRWLRFDINLWLRVMVLLLEWRLRGCAAQRRGVLGLRNQIVFCSERADNGHAQTISQSSIHDCAEKNLCLLVNVTAKFLLAARPNRPSDRSRSRSPSGKPRLAGRAPLAPGRCAVCLQM